MTRRFVVGYFEADSAAIKAVKALRAEGWQIYDVFTPYPVPGMDEAMDLPHSFLGWVAFINGMGGALGMLALALFVSVIAWPLNVGGRPDASIPAFFPPVFEAGVLSAGVTVVLALFWVCDLWPGKTAKLDLPRSTDDRFAVVLDADQSPHAGDRIIGALKAQGAVEVGEQSVREAL
ncbi:MAG TPA: DUF3341 domain-containing protein [bacterium]|jgi:hypothetical protein|nr:DUF3341 domain-containing protein [bacterium]